MGLDMYAYTVDQDLVEGMGEINISMGEVNRRAAAKLGMNVGTQEQFDALSAQEKQAYADNVDLHMKRAEQEGLINSEFAYWRKFNNLHGWMERLYNAKGGTDSFNCVVVRLMPEDLDRLENDVKGGKNLQPQAGFFFGGLKELNERDKSDILNFVAHARQAINEGKAVLYDSWW